MGIVVDRCSLFPRMLSLHAIHNVSINLFCMISTDHQDVCSHVTTVYNDSDMAPPNCFDHRSRSIWWYRCSSPSKRSTRSLDSHHLLHPLGHRRPARNGRTRDLFPTPYYPPSATPRSDRFGFPASRATRTRRIRNYAARKGSHGSLPANQHPTTCKQHRECWRDPLRSRMAHSDGNVGLRARLALLRSSQHYEIEIPLQYGLVGIYFPSGCIHDQHDADGKGVAE